MHHNLIGNINLHKNNEELKKKVILDVNMKGMKYVKLPKILEQSKTIVNIKNTDKKCFLWYHFFKK